MSCGKVKVAGSIKRRRINLNSLYLLSPLTDSPPIVYFSPVKQLSGQCGDI